MRLGRDSKQWTLRDSLFRSFRFLLQILVSDRIVGIRKILNESHGRIQGRIDTSLYSADVRPVLTNF